AQLAWKKVVGVEISEHWAEWAADNVARLRHKKTACIEVTQCNALDFDCSEGTVFYFFNPFGEQTIAAVLANIQESLVRQPRSVKLLYHNPLHRPLFDAADWLDEAAVVCRDRADRPTMLLYQSRATPLSGTDGRNF
ncbi:MAG: hypothetical protein AB7O62_23200, partial [Pirellulales bacterium]